MSAVATGTGSVATEHTGPELDTQITDAKITSVTCFAQDFGPVAKYSRLLQRHCSQIRQLDTQIADAKNWLAHAVDNGAGCYVLAALKEPELARRLAMERLRIAENSCFG